MSLRYMVCSLVFPLLKGAQEKLASFPDHISFIIEIKSMFGLNAHTKICLYWWLETWADHKQSKKTW